MAIIYVSSTSGVVRNTGTVYSAVRNAATGSLAFVGGTRTIGQSQISTTYTINRAYMAFNTSAITSNPLSATLNIYISLADGFDYIVEDAAAPNLVTDISVADYDAYIGSGFGIVFTPVEGWNVITLDSSALLLMNNNDIFKISIRSLNESINIAPDLQTEYDSLYFVTNVPYISYTSGYSNKIFSMVSSDLSKVNSIPMSTVIRVDGTPRNSYQYYRTPSADATTAACSYFIPDGSWVAIYTISTWAAGLTAYTDPGLTVPFNGSSYKWGISIDNQSGNLYPISSVGLIGTPEVLCFF